MCKPSRGIYRDVLQRLNTPHEDVAFVDDRRENVRAAELLGVRGVIWKGVDNARARLGGPGGGFPPRGPPVDAGLLGCLRPCGGLLGGERIELTGAALGDEIDDVGA